MKFFWKCCPQGKRNWKSNNFKHLCRLFFNRNRRLFLLSKIFWKFFRKSSDFGCPKWSLLCNEWRGSFLMMKTEAFSLVLWQLNTQVVKTLILMIATLVGTPKLLKISEQRELLLWVSDCNRYGDDSQKDNDTSLRSWRSTRQRLDSYDTDKQSVP